MARLDEDLQARCFTTVRAPRLTTENRLARLNFCRDVLQRVGVLSIRGKRHLKPLDLARVVFSDEKFFCWNYQGPARNSPIWVVGAHGRPVRKAHLDPDVCINKYSQGTTVGAAMVNGIVFPSVLHRTGCAKGGVRARQRRPFRAPPVMDQLKCTRLFFLIHGPKSLTVERVFFCGVLKPASALKAPAWTSAQATDCDLQSRLRKSTNVWCLSLSLCLPLPLPLHPPHHHFMVFNFPLFYRKLAQFTYN